jgi:hypothetical protein
MAPKAAEFKQIEQHNLAVEVVNALSRAMKK